MPPMFWGHSRLIRRCNSSSVASLQSNNSQRLRYRPPQSIISSTMYINDSISYLYNPSPAVKFALPKIKQIWKTTTGMQQHRAKTEINKKHASSAHKRATTILSEERNKPKGSSAKNVCDKIEGKYRVKLSRHTLNRYVKDGNIGSSPLRNGSPCTIPAFLFKTLCTAM